MKENIIHRHTKIIFTIGPATVEEKVLEKLIERGVDVCRFNMAHATHEWVEEAIEKIRKVCLKMDREIALLMDIKGPEIRTGFLDGEYILSKGDTLELWLTNSIVEKGNVHQVTVNYRDMNKDVSVGDTILVDSGLIRLEVQEISDDKVVTEVMTPGKLGSRRHINLPGVNIKLPSLTEKDHKDIKFGAEIGIDIFALSFARDAKAVIELREELRRRDSSAEVMAKLEDHTAMKNLEEIVDVSDSIMIARGDLGIEIPFEDLPAVQRKVVKECLRSGTPVVVATHLLESMIDSPMPTRAEITDVSNAVREQADCIMLSGETTTGKYPLEAVDVMNRMIDATEELLVDESFNTAITLKRPKSKLIQAGAYLAKELENGAMVIFTRSGYTARIAAALRPNGIPMYVFTDQKNIFRRMLMLWGIEPFLMDFQEDQEETICDAFEYLKRKGWCEKGAKLAVVTTANAKGRNIEVLQLRTVE